MPTQGTSSSASGAVTAQRVSGGRSLARTRVIATALSTTSPASAMKGIADILVLTARPTASPSASVRHTVGSSAQRSKATKASMHIAVTGTSSATTAA